MTQAPRSADQHSAKKPRTTPSAGSTLAVDLCQPPSEDDEHYARLTFNRSLNDELVLLVFSWLSAHDLCNSQLVNRHWARLSQDQQLWKALYLRQHGRERLRGSRGVYTTAPEDELAELGAGTGHSSTTSNRTRDWKYMFRVSANWSSGRCVVDDLSHAATPLSTGLSQAGDAVRRLHVLLADGLSFTASLTSSLVTAHNGQSVVRISSGRRLAPDVHVTAITVDQSRNKPLDDDSCSDLKLVVFYSDRSFSVFSVPLDDLTAASEVVSFTPPGRGAVESARTTHAAYHHPLLITLSDNFTLSMFVIQDTGPVVSVQRSQTLKSFTSFPPSSMVLSARSLSGARVGQVAYRLTLSYAIPIYPSHWSVGVTDLNIVRRGTDYSVEHAQSVKASSSRLPATPAIPKMTGLSAAQLKRRSSAPIVPVAQAAVVEDPVPPPRTASPPATIGYSESDDTELQRNRQQMALEREQWTRKVARVVATETDGRWVVLAGEQDGAALQVYRLSSRAGRLVFVRHLFGHRGVVTALAVADGRCVSLGASGEVWAWDLETGVGVEVDGTGEVDFAASEVPCTVAFDEMRVITGSAGCLRVRRFDL